MKTDREYIEFIDALRDTTYRLARSIINDDVEAEDVVQDVFERVWRARDAVLNSDYPRAYVCRMTRNLAIDRQRAKQRSRGFVISERSTSVDYGESDMGTKDMATITLKLIEQLPERQRLTIHMRDVEGYEIEEIAHILESDETSVRVNLSRARKSVREQLINMMNYGVGQN